MRSGIDLLEHINSEFPTVRGLILSMHPEELVALRALRAGASGYVQKRSGEDDLIAAIRSIAAGGNLRQSLAKTIAAEMLQGSVTTLLHERLADREFGVFRLLGSGHSVSASSRRPAWSRHFRTYNTVRELLMCFPTAVASSFWSLRVA